jgi:hypothetical protein
MWHRSYLTRKGAVSATLATVETYLSAAQAAFVAGTYDEARKQVILGEMELMKLVQQDGLEGQMSTFRQNFKDLLKDIESFQDTPSRPAQGTRRSTARLV